MYITSVTHPDDSITQEQFDLAINQLIAAPQHMKHHLPDLDALLPNFSWVGKEHIHDMLSKTTQHYVTDKCVPMCKHFCSHFPGMNIWHLPEWFVMDTFIAGVLAFDDGVPGHGGCTMALVYGGLDSEFLSGHPMSSESSVPTTLWDSSVIMVQWKVSNLMMQSHRLPLQ